MIGHKFHTSHFESIITTFRKASIVSHWQQYYINLKGDWPHPRSEMGRHMSRHDYYEKEKLLRAKNVVQALWFAKNQIPSAVREETGEALDEVLSSILPALLIALAIVAGATLAGLSVGSIIGGLAGGGVGAIPGAAAGGKLGFSAGLWILEWMGLAFLAVYVGQHLYEVTRLLEQAFNESWGHGARKDFCMLEDHSGLGPREDIPDHARVMSAADKYAKAVAIVIRLILEGIVLYITARGVAKVPELVAQLKSSRLGPGFAAWVETNHLRLMNNPKLKRATATGAAAEQPVKVLDHTYMQGQTKPGIIKAESAKQKKAKALKANKQRGKSREVEVKKELQSEGHDVLGSQVSVKTPETRRVVDHLIKEGLLGLLCIDSNLNHAL